ncbi:uncharacterized protein LOC142166031 [Nicotiana tabacum]|uniref:Uncharacterized protein LOC142166031 n=1 Tax=Nicotiana tabacum TaxID=4097 RepID=A0AC58S6F8_TOBAC
MASIIRSFMATCINNEWIVDTGATDHMVSNSKMTSEKHTTDSESSAVHFPNGSQLPIAHIGKCKLNRGEISGVLCDLHTGKVKGTGRLLNELYYWDHKHSNKMAHSVVLHFGRTIKVFRSDNGTEFFNTHYHDTFSSTWIIHQSSCVHIPQQNGVMERKHRQIVEVARSIRFQDNAQVDHSISPPNMVEPVECSPGTHSASVHSELACPIESPADISTTSITNTDAPPVVVRRSSRPSKTPGWLHGFVHQVPTRKNFETSTASLASMYHISSYMSYTSLSDSYFKIVCNFSAVKEPTSYAEAMDDPKWIDTMDQELKVLNEAKWLWIKN